MRVAVCHERLGTVLNKPADHDNDDFQVALVLSQGAPQGRAISKMNGCCCAMVVTQVIIVKMRYCIPFNRLLHLH